jgi:hypothetical protein
MSEPTTYRFTLRRSITDNPTRPLGICMVNPSMASEEFVDDKTSNDNTIRSVCRIAAHNGFDGIMVVNVSPFRATDPDRLVDAIRAGLDVFTPVDNDPAIAAMCARCEVVVAAWGAIPLKHRVLELRTSEVRAALLRHKPVVHCFGRTKDGWPKHPLFLPPHTQIVPFATRGA